MDFRRFGIESARLCLKVRNEDSYKGDYGHVLLAVGSPGMCGAAILSASACLHSGAGLLTVLSDDTCRLPMQISVPEAMFISELPENTNRFSVVGCGCGMGQSGRALAVLRSLLVCGRPLVLDADALNLVAKHSLFDMLPQGSILTPHVGEFDRLTGGCENNEERELKAKAFAADYKVYVILKGHRTHIFTPYGNVYENTTGNAGMATAGSGDVLCGIISSLAAQKYEPETAAVLGVFIHGLAGDCAAEILGEEYMTAGDIIRHLSAAFGILHGKSNFADNLSTYNYIRP